MWWLFSTRTPTRKSSSRAPRGSHGITAVAVSPSKRYVAVAETGARALVNIYDVSSLRRKKSFSSSEMSSKKFISLAFSPDGKYLLAQTAEPDWMLLYWPWEKQMKVMASLLMGSQTHTDQYGHKSTGLGVASALSPICEVALSPRDSTVVSVLSSDSLRVYRYGENALKQFASYSLRATGSSRMVCHCWVADDRIIVGTETGELLLFDGGDLKFIKILKCSPDEGVAIDAVTKTSRGFIAAGDKGAVYVYTAMERGGAGGEPYQLSRRVHIEDSPSCIHSLSVSPSEEAVLIAQDNNQLYTMLLANPEVLSRDDEVVFQHLTQSFHAAPITGLDVCIRKPLAVTCSGDQTIRLWNYVDNVDDVVKQFAEEIYSVALHPSGFHLVAGFADKLRLMNVLMNDIEQVLEFPLRACREVRFSNGGQYFAAVNGNVIQLFNTYTFENFMNLRGHNNKVQSIVWSADDTRIVSAGGDGAIYEWTVADGKRENECVIKSCSYTSVVVSSDTQYVYASGSDSKLREVHDSSVVREFSASRSGPARGDGSGGDGAAAGTVVEAGAQREDGDGTVAFSAGSVNVNLAHIAISNNGQQFFGATNQGSIRSYRFPLTGEYVEYQAHHGPVSRLRVSHDGYYLFSVGHDGLLMIMSVKDVDDPSRVKGPEDVSDEVLVSRSDLEDTAQRMAELKEKVNEVTTHNDYQLRLRDLECQERLKDAQDRFNQEIESLRGALDTVQHEKRESEDSFQARVKDMEAKHGKSLHAAEGMKQREVRQFEERLRMLEAEKEAAEESFQRQLTATEERHQRAISELVADYQNRLMDDHMAHERAAEEKNELIREFSETKRQVEEDADMEIEELKTQYEMKLAQERQDALRLKGENGILKKKFTTLKSDIEKMNAEIDQLYETKRSLKETISNLEKDIDGLQREIKERDETIGDKENRIFDLKKKNQELEKFKFVLDYRIRELKKKIEPREMEISEMKKQMKDMDSELELYVGSNKTLKLAIKDLKMKIAALNTEITKQRKKIQDSDAELRRIRIDLYDAVQCLRDPKMLKDVVKKLYQKHVTSSIRSVGLDEDVQKEYDRQREYLERSVMSLRRKLAKDVELQRADNVRIMQENVLLIKEINQLRRELRELKQQNKQVTAASAAAQTRTTAANSRRRRAAKLAMTMKLQSHASRTLLTSAGGSGSAPVSAGGPVSRTASPGGLGSSPAGPGVSVIGGQVGLSDMDASAAQVREMQRMIALQKAEIDHLRYTAPGGSADVRGPSPIGRDMSPRATTDARMPPVEER